MALVHVLRTDDSAVDLVLDVSGGDVNNTIYVRHSIRRVGGDWPADRALAGEAPAAKSFAVRHRVALHGLGPHVMAWNSEAFDAVCARDCGAQLDLDRYVENLERFIGFLGCGAESHWILRRGTQKDCRDGGQPWVPVGGRHRRKGLGHHRCSCVQSLGKYARLLSRGKTPIVIRTWPLYRRSSERPPTA